MSRAWCRLMVVWSWAVILFGVILATAGFKQSAGLAGALLALLGPTPEMDAPMRFSTGLMGAVSLGWGVTLLGLASVSDQLEQVVARRLWARVGWAVAIWCAVDSVISALNGYALNLIPNALLAASFVALLWRGGVLGRQAAVPARLA